MTFEEAVRSLPVILMEGAVIERLRREPAVALDPHVADLAFLYKRGRMVLERMHRTYLDLGCSRDLPMIALTPTWRASPERLRAANLAGVEKVNIDGVRFLQRIRDSYLGYAGRILIGGLMGCRGDAYNPRDALAEEEAANYHSPQAEVLAGAGADFLMAATLPAVGEAAGIARAMAGCARPYVLSFVVRPSGTLLDGTPLHEALTRIDSVVHPPPLGYMVNCVHPEVFREAMERTLAVRVDLRGRVLGLQANTSKLSPEQLEGSGQVESDQSPDVFARAMIAVYRRYGLRILGGCCGTDERHISAIADEIQHAEQPPPAEAEDA